MKFRTPRRPLFPWRINVVHAAGEEMARAVVDVAHGGSAQPRSEHRAARAPYTLRALSRAQFIMGADSTRDHFSHQVTGSTPLSHGMRWLPPLPRSALPVRTPHRPHGSSNSGGWSCPGTCAGQCFDDTALIRTPVFDGFRCAAALPTPSPRLCRCIVHLDCWARHPGRWRSLTITPRVAGVAGNNRQRRAGGAKTDVSVTSIPAVSHSRRSCRPRAFDRPGRRC